MGTTCSIHLLLNALSRHRNGTCSQSTPRLPLVIKHAKNTNMFQGLLVTELLLGTQQKNPPKSQGDQKLQHIGVNQLYGYLTLLAEEKCLLR